MVPPPFALLQTTFEAAINSVVFDSQRDTLLVLLATGKLVLVENYLSPTDPQTSAAGLPPQLTAKDPSQRQGPRMKMTSVLLPQVLDAKPWTLASLLWTHYDNESSQLVFAGKSGQHDRLVLGCVDCDEGTVEIQATIRHTSLYQVRRVREILRLPLGDDSTPAADGQPSLSLAVQTQSGAVYTMNPHQVASQATRIPGKFPMFSHLTILNYHTTTKSDQQEGDAVVVIGLESSSARLFVNGESLASACSSFRYCAVSSVLLYTTQGRESQLRMVPLAALRLHSKDPASLAESGSSKTHEVRSIERGALLIATVGDSAKVIVQMPRGNLECVTPRLLVLALVVQLIKSRKYVAALEMCRRHRLDLNVLVDFDPCSFLEHVTDFWLKVSLDTRAAAVTSDRLCLFITNLHPVDVWNTKYGPLLAPFVATPTAIQESEGDVAYTPDGKVNVVCQLMMRAIQELEKSDEFEAALLLPFVTCAVKQSPPRFEQALAKVQALLQRSREEGGTESSAATYRKAATRAIKHLIMLTDVERLYSEALGMYDLELVRVVAIHSQRDPKEYVPFMDRVARFKDEHWRKYTIDEHLGRHARALVHLSALIHGLAGDDEAEKSKLQGLALTLIDQGDLYDQALALFPIAAAKTTANASDHAFHQQILMLKGGFLEAEKRFEAAAYVYLSAADQEKARRAFLAANKWQMALTLSARKQQTAQELRNEAYAIAQELLNQQQQQNGSVDAVLAVARIYVEYCDDIDEAVALLVAHQQWAEALRIASLYKREDLIESDVESGVLQSYDDVLEELERNEALYIKHRKRLTAIQEQKRLFKLHGIDGSRWTDDKGDVDTDSVRSGASSAADSALSNVSMSSVGSHNNAASIGNFSMQSLSLATSSHFYATQTLGDVDKKPKGKAKHGGTLPRRERRRRMKEGSAEEEAYVTQQLSELVPSPALTRDVGALLQMLVFFGHMQRAQKLQTQLGGFERRVEVENPPPSAAADKVQWRLNALLG
ncbi:hypothetical protein BBJ28_00020255 [Nothophytophthora sp. Chile5]|nr:hypothetical protein BBJ28_00020255 [Nothophytophthora sp. Chile5]